MKLIIGNMSPRLQEFIRKHHFTSCTMVINKMCNVKVIKDEVDIIIPFGYLLDNGLISNTMVHLEELIMSVDAKSIKYGNPSYEEKLIEVANKYHVPIERIDLRSKNKLTL